MAAATEVVETNMQETPPVVVTGEDKRVWAERVLSDMLRLMGLPAKLDFKDAEDGSLSVAVMFETDIPGVVAGKRSQMMESLQFLLNKIVNRVGVERRWVNLGAYGHPPVRAPRKEPVAMPAVEIAAPVATVSPRGPLPRNGKKNGQAEKPVVSAAARVPEVDEMTLDVKADKVFSAAAKALMEKSAKYGRFFAVFAMKPEDRGRFLQSVAKAKGASAKAEGEGSMRRVLVTPAEPKPMPKYQLPDWDDEEELDEE